MSWGDAGGASPKASAAGSARSRRVLMGCAIRRECILPPFEERDHGTIEADAQRPRGSVVPRRALRPRRRPGGARGEGGSASGELSPGVAVPGGFAAAEAPAERLSLGLHRER